MTGLVGAVGARSKGTNSAVNGVHSWCRWYTNSGTHIRRSFNVASLTDNGTANTTIHLIVPHKDAHYSISYSTITQVSNNGSSCNVTGQTASQYGLNFFEDGSQADGEFRCASFGD